MNNVQSVAFDIDGTLAVTGKNELFPGTKDRLQRIRAHVGPKAMCVITNQGGPAWSEITRQKGQLFNRYPSVTQTAERLSHIARLTGLVDVRWYIAVHGGVACPLSMSTLVDIAADLTNMLKPMCVKCFVTLDSRKPWPTMLQCAVSDLGWEPATSLYIGDQDIDSKAAQAAGWQFMKASAWRG